MKSHALIDDRGLAFGRAIAARVAKRPELIAVARGNIMRWLETCSPGTRPALEEWLAVLDGPQEAVVALLRNTSERAIRLRQSNPFARVLTPQERTAIIRRFETHDRRLAAARLDAWETG